MPRESARLMVTWREDPGRVEHVTIGDLPRFARTGDVFVLNQTRVLAARLVGRRRGTGGRVEGLYLRAEEAKSGPRRWVALLKGKSVQAGIRIDLEDDTGGMCGVSLEPLAKVDDEPGAWVVAVEGAGVGAEMGDAEILDRAGLTPLPPYILKARKVAADVVPDAADREWYSTSFDRGSPTSVAAPTAGFHLTEAVREGLARAGAGFEHVELAVGIGTFRPIESEFVEGHAMHREWCTMTAGTKGKLVAARQHGGRVLCVGTTAARTVESCADLAEESVWTRLLITPGYSWKIADGLLTNFHLPRSTLLAMVASLFKGGVPVVKALYAQAIARGYRFFSYGDAMLILPGKP